MGQTTFNVGRQKIDEVKETFKREEEGKLLAAKESLGIEDRCVDYSAD